MARFAWLIAVALSFACGGQGKRGGTEVGICEGYSNPQLETTIAESFGAFYGPKPTPEQLRMITALTANDLETLDGIQCLPNLRQLAVGKLATSDLSPLVALAQLEQLQVTESAPPKLSSLGMEASAHVTSLHIEDCGPLALEELAAFPALLKLNLAGNELTKIDDLPELPALEELVLDKNSLTDLGRLLGLSHLKSLSVVANRLASLSSLNGHVGLLYVTASRNELTTLRDLKQAALWRLDVQQNQIDELGSLEGLPLLLGLQLAGNATLNSVTGIAAAKRLVEVSLDSTSVVDLTELGMLPSLEQLWLGRLPRALDLSPLAPLTQIARLDLESSSVTSLSPLQSWAQLDGSCRQINLNGVRLQADSVAVARQLCSSAWAMEPVCSGTCAPQG